MSDTREQRVDKATPQSTREVPVMGGPLPWQDWLMWKGCFGWHFHFWRICTPRECCFRCLTSSSVASCPKVVVAVDSGDGGMGSEYDGTASKMARIKQLHQTNSLAY
mmetsp:Transcript_5310/g.8354  ORF Transcript_5310/g.8354 Transcript_5310/m.8354 type:complete len:107 (+) Transcript_5310:526-846(+)